MCSADVVPLLSVSVLSLVKSAQQQHGLRHADYQRYHQYVTRKIRRMRKSLHFQQGTRSKVTPKKITAEFITDQRCIILAIFEIERSWAYAMQLKAESNTELRKRFQMISRLRKAVSRADYLCSLEEDLPMLDAKTKLELRAYNKWIQGVLFFEIQNWVKAKESLESSQAIYHVLSQMVDEDNQTLYKSRIDDLLPQVRYCAYNIGDKSAATDLQRMRALAPDTTDILTEMQLDQLLDQARAGQASQVTEVEWLGMTIPVKLEKAKMAILAVNELDMEVKKAEGYQTKLAVYENTLKSCLEALTSVRDELRLAVASEASATGDNTASILASSKTGNVLGSDKVMRLQLLYTYLQYLKLSKTIDRTLLHIQGALSSSTNESVVKNGIATSSYSKPQELSRLYDTIVQNFQELLSLPIIFQDHNGLKDLLQAKMLASRSYRCYYLALAYNSNKKYTECSALLGRVRIHTENAISSLSSRTATWNAVEEAAAPGPNAEQMIQALQLLLQQADAEDLTCRAAYILDTENVPNDSEVSSQVKMESEMSQKTLIDRLDYFADENVIQKNLTSLLYPFVNLPPNFKPVPVKPIFFDLALNSIVFPSLTDENDAKNVSKPASGIGGLMRGWLWGDKSSAQQ